MGIDGFDDLMDDLEELEDDLEEFEGEHDVPLTEMFTEEFMQTYTDFESIEAFFGESPWEVESQEDLEAIPDGEADKYVAEHTAFDTSDEMLSAAGNEWTKRQLGL